MSGQQCVCVCVYVCVCVCVGGGGGGVGGGGTGSEGTVDGKCMDLLVMCKSYHTRTQL